MPWMASCMGCRASQVGILSEGKAGQGSCARSWCTLPACRCLIGAFPLLDLAGSLHAFTVPQPFCDLDCGQTTALARASICITCFSHCSQTTILAHASMPSLCCRHCKLRAPRALFLPASKLPS